VQQLLAVVVVGGLSIPTLASLLALPALSDWFNPKGPTSDPLAQTAEVNAGTGTPV
jgi:Cu/Ag efflux pump CusA